MAIEAGQQLLHFRLIEKIGEGGMVEERAVVAFEVDDPSGQRARVLLPATHRNWPGHLNRAELNPALSGHKAALTDAGTRSRSDERLRPGPGDLALGK